MAGYFEVQLVDAVAVRMRVNYIPMLLTLRQAEFVSCFTFVKFHTF